MVEKEQGVPEVEPKKRMTLYEQLESGGLASLASMEGSWAEWEEAVVEPKKSLSIILFGVVGAALVMALAWVLHQLPFPPFTYEGGALEHPIGVSVLAILLGVAVANFFPQLDLRAGCRWITTWCIPAAVVFLGARMDVNLLVNIGWGLLFTIVGLMVFAVAISYGVGRMFGMSKRASCLLGVGTAVCGSSAILAVAPVAGADDEEVVVTVGVVNLVGLLAMFTCVALLWLMPMDASLFGAWAGSTIHAVPQVVAAGDSHGVDSAAMATLVKLTRVTMLAPVVLIAALLVARRSSRAGKARVSSHRKLWQYVPWFVWGFIALVTVRAFGWLPVLEFHSQSSEVIRISLAELLPTIAKWLLALSMAAIGLQVQLRPMLKAGGKAFLAGTISWVALSTVAFFSLRYVLG